MRLFILSIALGLCMNIGVLSKLEASGRVMRPIKPNPCKLDPESEKCKIRSKKRLQ